MNINKAVGTTGTLVHQEDGDKKNIRYCFLNYKGGETYLVTG